MADEEIEVIDLSAIQRNRTYLQKILGDVTRQSAAKQVVIGGASGWVAGYVSVKVGKSVAMGIGGSLLLLRIAQHQGYVKIDWSRLNRDIDKTRRKVEREARRQYPGVVDSLVAFVQQNMFLAGSFAGGFFIGMAF